MPAVSKGKQATTLKEQRAQVLLVLSETIEAAHAELFNPEMILDALITSTTVYRYSLIYGGKMAEQHVRIVERRAQRAAKAAVEKTRKEIETATAVPVKDTMGGVA